MGTKIGVGVVAGLIGGLLFGLVLQMTMVTVPGGSTVPLIASVANIIGQSSSAAGWLYHLLNSAVIGAIFGLIFASRIFTWRSGLMYGVLYGIGWWILGGLVLMPMLLGLPALAPLTVSALHPIAAANLIGHIVYGAATGLAFNWIYNPLLSENYVR